MVYVSLSTWAFRSCLFHQPSTSIGCWVEFSLCVSWKAHIFSEHFDIKYSFWQNMELRLCVTEPSKYRDHGATHTVCSTDSNLTFCHNTPVYSCVRHFKQGQWPGGHVFMRKLRLRPCKLWWYHCLRAALCAHNYHHLHGRNLNLRINTRGQRSLAPEQGQFGPVPGPMTRGQLSAHAHWYNCKLVYSWIFVKSLALSVSGCIWLCQINYRAHIVYHHPSLNVQTLTQIYACFFPLRGIWHRVHVYI